MLKNWTLMLVRMVLRTMQRRAEDGYATTHLDAMRVRFPDHA